jgi:hypothetical protein
MPIGTKLRCDRLQVFWGPLRLRCPLRQRWLRAGLLLGVSACFTTIVHACTPGYRSLILGDNPLVYYEFEETSGTTTANSAITGSFYDGLRSGTVTVNQPSFTEGGASYDFGGGRIVVSALTRSLTEWTVSTWVNYDSRKTAGSNFLATDQNGWNNDVLLGIGPEEGNAEQVGPGNVGVIQQGAPGSIRDFAGAPLAAGEWHHIAVTGSTTSGKLSLFIDGLLAASDTDLVNGVTFNGADGIGDAKLTIGASRTDGMRPYDGLLDEVAIFDYVLTPAQITAHAAAVPEPSTYMLLGLSALAIAGYASRRRRRAQRYIPPGRKQKNLSGSFSNRGF